jgi:glycosyltransferase involved in cell wall biosynthesis
MRVLHVAAGNLYGGVERILVAIASSPTSWQHEFALCFDGRLREELHERDASCHMLGEVRFRRPTTVWRARRRLSALCAKSHFDAIVCHSPWAFGLAAPACAGIRRVLWAHNALDGSHWTERRVRRTPPDLIICNSEYTSEAIAAWTQTTPRAVIYAPVMESRTTSDARREVRHQLGVGHTTAVILIASRLEEGKGHRTLVEAVSGLRGDWALWMAGGAQQQNEEQLARDIEAAVQTSGLDNRVRLLGERRDVPRLLRGADILCQPNLKAEPFGIVFVEALIAGVPVVTSDMGGAREIVTPDCGVLLPPGDVAALRATLQQLIDDRERRSRLGAAGPLRARALTNPATQIAALEHLLAPQPKALLAHS